MVCRYHRSFQNQHQLHGNQCVSQKWPLTFDLLQLLGQQAEAYAEDLQKTLKISSLVSMPLKEVVLFLRVSLGHCQKEVVFFPSHSKTRKIFLSGWGLLIFDSGRKAVLFMFVPIFPFLFMHSKNSLQLSILIVALCVKAQWLGAAALFCIFLAFVLYRVYSDLHGPLFPCGTQVHLWLLPSRTGWEHHCVSFVGD